MSKFITDKDKIRVFEILENEKSLMLLVNTLGKNDGLTAEDPYILNQDVEFLQFLFSWIEYHRAIGKPHKKHYTFSQAKIHDGENAKPQVEQLLGSEYEVYKHIYEMYNTSKIKQKTNTRKLLKKYELGCIALSCTILLHNVQYIMMALKCCDLK